MGGKPIYAIWIYTSKNKENPTSSGFLQ